MLYRDESLLGSGVTVFGPPVIGERFRIKADLPAAMSDQKWHSTSLSESGSLEDRSQLNSVVMMRSDSHLGSWSVSTSQETLTSSI